MGALKLSYCMIVKDEERHLARCLASVQPYVDELVVVDTGSSDRTPEIAREFGATVHCFEWCDDFAAARNFAIDQVSGDWILTLDADEELVVEQENWRQGLFLDEKILAYSIDLLDAYQPLTPLKTNRLFRNLPGLRYAERYHEHLKYQNQLILETQIQALQSLKILHYGYEESLLQEKHLTRDIPMLERVRQKESLSLVLLLTLANGYLRVDQLEKAQELWTEAFDRIAPNLMTGILPDERNRLPALLFTLGSDACLSREDYETTLLICRRGLEWFPAYPPLHHLTGYALRELGFSLGAIAYFEQCLHLGRTGTYYQREPFDRDFITVRPAGDLGWTYLNLNRIEEAIVAFELALSFNANYEPAIVGLQQAREMLANQ
ncbi:MAG: glycosyltransferase family 2 protein [Leptolyngbyaceae cyanobacterium bins.59]|nr:glycosyltransferase family 2 protein [Leptolyngbyaceae cyanobacterium bins.59]